MHFAFVSIPAYGHVNPTLPLVAELVSRGHRVTYFTSTDFEPRIRRAGAAFRASGGNWLASLPGLGGGQRPPAHVMLPIMTKVFEDIRSSFPALVELLRQDPPDAVCFDAMTLSGSMAAEKIGAPAIALLPTYATNEHFSLRTLMPAPPPGSADEMAKVRMAMGRLLAEFAAEQGVRTPRMFDGPPAPFNIVFIPREFQPMGETFDDRFRFVGPSVGGRDDDGEWIREGTGPLLFISLGTTPLNCQPDFFKMCLDAFGGGGWDVAMAVGEQTSVADLGTIAPNVRIRPFFPQLQVLRQAAVFITHAGMNSTMEALYFAVPMLAVPQQPEQAATARRLEELGLGRRLAAEEVTPEALRAGVDALHADAQVRRNVAAMSDIVRNAGGSAAAADAIEAHVRHGAGRFGNVG
ncbi:macrolide family glycosyltransferase [Arthrobacter oryzae]|uniref:MGT family glycosyltransferase n=1 Tax=Arthrobacter oryzae TaxID=409290 RepID=A0A495FNZ0_9MICC|nr:macrolide family glycosyltransferase [Arthrobacter oryzae]RKR30451.1 MGT family glycosyltransferase [Arthrobacter oryzae]